MTELNINFGRFTLKNSLGKGSFGEVYKAYDSQLKQDVAIKVLHQGLMADINFINKARKEASLVQQIQHPNVVKIIELGEADGRAYIEMELIDGQPLSDILQAGRRFNIEQIVSFIEQISSALEATHAKKIIHRDVKPANILIDKSGITHLADFGLAHAAKSSLGSSSTSAGLGTAKYMSPEQALGQTGDKTSDVYSLGIVAYELFTGRAPFEADNLPGYIDAHLHQKPPDPRKLNPGVTKAIQGVLSKVLSKKPGSRYKNTGEFARALRKANEKPDSGRGRVSGCMGVVFVLIVVGVIASWMVYAGPLKGQAQELLVRFIPGNKYTTVISTDQPSVTPEIINTPASETPDQTSASTTVAAEPTHGTVSSTLVPTPTQAAAIIPAPSISSGGLSALVGTGVRVEKVKGNNTGIVVRLMTGTGEAITEHYVEVYTQKQDIAGNWVVDKREKTEYTDNSGQVFFELSPGDYIITSGFDGYNWGSARDVMGQASVNVEAGKTTQLTLSLGRLTIGFLRGNGEVITDQYVQIYLQKQDLAGNWVVDSRINSGGTNNTGLISFDLTPGYYIVATDLQGYNWGNATDLEGMTSISIQPGVENRMVISLGQLQAGLTDFNGKPITDQYIKVYTQIKDVSGNPALGSNVDSGSTDNTGIFVSNLAAGQYAIQINEQVLYNIEVKEGKITFTDGTQWQIK